MYAPVVIFLSFYLNLSLLHFANNANICVGVMILFLHRFPISLSVIVIRFFGARADSADLLVRAN